MLFGRSLATDLSVPFSVDRRFRPLHIQAYLPPPVSKGSRLPQTAQTSASLPPPRVPGAQGGFLDGRGWIYAPGPDWGVHYCQLTALTRPRGGLCVHLGVPV